MPMFVLYLLVVGTLVYFIAKRGRAFPPQTLGVFTGRPQSAGLRPKKDPREIWKQVYETASMEEARMIRARLEEEGLECILYEQGKKDIHGNLLKGVGIAVPSTSASLAQSSIAKMPV